MDVKIFIMIAPANYFPTHTAEAWSNSGDRYRDDSDELQKANDQLSSFLADIKRLTSITVSKEFRTNTRIQNQIIPTVGFSNQRKVGNTQNALTCRPLEEFKSIVHKISEIVKANSLVVIESSSPLSDRGKALSIFEDSDEDHKAPIYGISAKADNLTDLLHSEIKTALDRPKAGRDIKSFTNLIPTKLFGETIDLLFSSLDYLISLKDHSHYLPIKVNLIFLELIDEIANTLSQCFNTLSKEQKILIRNISSGISNNIRDVMNGSTRAKDGSTIRDKILDLPSISTNRLSKAPSAPRNKAKHKKETKPRQ